MTTDNASAGVYADSVIAAMMYLDTSEARAERWIKLEDDGEGTLICSLPIDGNFIEAMLEDGSKVDALFTNNHLEPGDCDFCQVNEAGDPEDCSIMDRVIAWRPLSAKEGSHAE